MMKNLVRNSRKGGGLDDRKVTPRVIVDMREFRSELPSLLHKRGMYVCSGIIVFESRGNTRVFYCLMDL